MTESSDAADRTTSDRLALHMRACRTFTDQPVDRAVIAALIEAARWTGSARNRQPWHWTVCTSAADRGLIATSGYYAAFVADAPLVIVLSTNPDIGGRDTDFDAGRAVQQLLTAAHLHGLGACPVTLDRGRRAALVATLGVPPGWQPGWAVALGHAAPALRLGPSAIPAGRKPIDEIVTWRGSVDEPEIGED